MLEACAVRAIAFWLSLSVAADQIQLRHNDHQHIEHSNVSICIIDLRIATDFGCGWVCTCSVGCFAKIDVPQTDKFVLSLLFGKYGPLTLPSEKVMWEREEREAETGRPEQEKYFLLIIPILRGR